MSKVVIDMTMSLDRFVAAPEDHRRTYDITNGWGGAHPVNVRRFVLTHTPPPADSDGPLAIHLRYRVVKSGSHTG